MLLNFLHIVLYLILVIKMICLIITALCYTVCTISDKYSISKYELSGNEFTFLMGASSCIFMLPALFLTELRFDLSVGSFLTIVLLSVDKIAEFATSAAVLKKLSGFETKAWLGTAMFISYFTDIIFYDESFEAVKLLFIFIVCGCLFMMVRDGKNTEQGRYKGIRLLLFLYILSKYFYGLIIKAGGGHISPTAGVYSAMIVITVIYFFRADVPGLVKGKLKGSVIVSLTRIPNIAGLICENILIGTSLTIYSMEQPVILALLLIWSFIRRENTSRISVISGIVCLMAVFAFKLV